MLGWQVVLAAADLLCTTAKGWRRKEGRKEWLASCWPCGWLTDWLLRVTPRRACERATARECKHGVLPPASSATVSATGRGLSLSRAPMLSSTAQHSLCLASQRTTFHVQQQQRILSSSLSNCMHFFSTAPAAGWLLSGWIEWIWIVVDSSSSDGSVCSCSLNLNNNGASLARVPRPYSNQQYVLVNSAAAAAHCRIGTASSATKGDQSKAKQP